ncbi:hypothetical protein HKX48_002431 [Thoreauomyces humboldtii]|nr:hypothetical protein HKX48_002431 [Thoreauomyces humboldtii]
MLYVMLFQEQKLIDAPLGKWDPVVDLAAQSMRWESFGMLLWALKIIDGVPRYHVRFPQELLFQATAIVPAFPATITGFLEFFSTGEGSSSPSHRLEEQEFRGAINTAEAWYWRARAQVVLDLRESLKGDSDDVKEARKKIPSGLKTIMSNMDTALSQASIRASTDGYIEAIVGEDFGVDGTAYRDLDDHMIRDTNDIAENRLAALSWLAGREWDFERGEVAFIHPLGSLWHPQE